MIVLGIDIGTTTISGVVLEDKKLLISKTKKNDSFLQTDFSGEKAQDVSVILETALGLVEELLAEHPSVERIGITGQMHGILYVDAQGQAVSPLYTWQNERGNELVGDQTFAESLQEQTGHFVATGYGLVTYAYHRWKGFVPEKAVTCCTIGDYLAMKLCGSTKPVMDPSNGASLGFFDVAVGDFDEKALAKIGVDRNFLPEIAKEPFVGCYKDSVKVYRAIGDNQASFLGARQGNLDGALVNVGTGSQISLYTKDFMEVEGLETRPMPQGGYLLVGASLCGGRAYALLEQMFRGVWEMRELCGETEDKDIYEKNLSKREDCYDAITKLLASNKKPNNLPTITPLFQGTRQDPSKTAGITGLTVENFTPLHLTWAMMEGMALELYQMGKNYFQAGGKITSFMGSGNGLRKNPYLQQCVEECFAMKLTMSECQEEAATGAAYFALSC